MKDESIEFALKQNSQTLVWPVQQGFYLRYGKRAFDLAICIVLLPIVVVFGILFLVLNPFLNPGSLFYFQPRMGKGCRAFSAVKFRTMLPVERVTRGPDDPLEIARITRLGNMMRKSRIDELPQVFNVFLGQMSLIGPRPDYFHHARRYIRTVDGYRQRHCITPGISGLAQTDLGYVQSTTATRRKVELDLRYIRERSFRMDMYVFFRTLATVFAYGRNG